MITLDWLESYFLCSGYSSPENITRVIKTCPKVGFYLHMNWITRYTVTASDRYNPSEHEPVFTVRVKEYVGLIGQDSKRLAPSGGEHSLRREVSNRICRVLLFFFESDRFSAFCRHRHDHRRVRDTTTHAEEALLRESSISSPTTTRKTCCSEMFFWLLE